MALKKTTIENNAIPPDFGKDESTLICILYGKNSIDKYVKKHVEKEYHGKYEFVNIKNIEAEKYNDTIKYRYTFDGEKVTNTVSSYNSTTGKTEERDITTHSFFIMDNITGVTYRSPVTSDHFSRLIQAYMINLEKERMKN